MRKELWLLIIACFVSFGAGLFIDGLCCQGHAHGEASQPSQLPSDWAYWGDISNRWQAVFGAFAIAFSYLLWRVSKKANDTSRAALRASTTATNEQKRSVDAFVEAERGRLFLFKNAVRIDEGQCHYAFKNIGNGPLAIVQYAYTPFVFGVNEEVPGPQKAQNINGTNYPLMSGECFSSCDWDDDATRKSNMSNFGTQLTSDQCDKIRAGTHRLFVQYDIIYKTLGILYQFRETIIFSKRKKGITRNYVAGTAAQFDKRRTDQFTPERVSGMREWLIKLDEEAEKQR